MSTIETVTRETPSEKKLDTDVITIRECRQFKNKHFFL